MNNSSEWENRLEKLLESLIKMLGKSNEKVDDLNIRVHQLEWCLKHIDFQEKNSLAKDPQIPHHVNETAAKKFPLTI